MGQVWPLFVYFNPFLNTIIDEEVKIDYKNVYGVIGIRTLWAQTNPLSIGGPLESSAFVILFLQIGHSEKTERM